MTEQTTIQENSTKKKASNIIRWVIASAGIVLFLLTAIMAIYRKYGG